MPYQRKSLTFYEKLLNGMAESGKLNHTDDKGADYLPSAAEIEAACGQIRAQNLLCVRKSPVKPDDRPLGFEYARDVVIGSLRGRLL